MIFYIREYEGKKNLYAYNINYCVQYIFVYSFLLKIHDLKILFNFHCNVIYIAYSYTYIIYTIYPEHIALKLKTSL